MSDYVVMPKEDYQAICDATRAKTGTTDLLKSGEVANKINEIKDSDVYTSHFGALYTKNMVLSGLRGNNTGALLNSQYQECTNLETVDIDGKIQTNSLSNVFANCPNLKSAIIKNFTKYSHYWFSGCPALEIAILGNINVPVTRMANYVFSDCIQNNLTITVYVNATTLADIPTDVTSTAPWGATNATIIYRNSTTGEVITS